jgi:hypothetical protein
MPIAYPSRKVFTTASTTATLASVAGGSLLVAAVGAFRFSAGNTQLVSGVTSHGGTRTWTRVADADARRVASGSNHTHETSIWYLTDAPAGSAPVVVAPVIGDGATQLAWGVMEYTGARTSAAVEGPGRQIAVGANSPSVAVPTTGTLSQADVVVVGILCNKYGYAFTVPPGWTALDDSNGGLSSFPSVQTAHVLPNATTAIAATFGQVDQVDQGACASVAVFLGGAVALKRIEITGIEAAVDGTTGWTIYHWLTDGATITAQRVQNVSAEVTGGRIHVVDASVPNVADGTDINCVGYRPGGTPIRGLVGVVTGKVKDYS